MSREIELYPVDKLKTYLIDARNKEKSIILLDMESQWIQLIESAIKNGDYDKGYLYFYLRIKNDDKLNESINALDEVARAYSKAGFMVFTSKTGEHVVKVEIGLQKEVNTDKKGCRLINE
jgi:hypothetical protein